MSSDQLERYSRQILLDEVGVDGQRILLRAKALVIGAGGLGAPASIYLAAAGVGTIGIVDADSVEVSNLHRQVVHDDADVGRAKTASAKARLEAQNPDVTVVEHHVLLDSSNALDIFAQYDIIVNGCDNFATRYLVNDACVLLHKPLVDASILRFHGQMTVFLPGQGCYRCLFPEPPAPGTVPSCGEAGIIGALAGHMGTLQAVETVKLLLGIGTPLSEKLLLYDALHAEHRYVGRKRDPQCQVCGDEPVITELIDYEAFCGVPAEERQLVVDGITVAQRERELIVTETQSSSERGRAADGSVTPNAAPNAGHGAAAEVRPAETSLQDALLVQGWAREPGELRDLLGNDDVRWIDVREDAEWKAVRFSRARHIPLGELGTRLAELDPEVPTYILCRSGRRSATVTQVLRENGWNNVYNVNGGLIAWANEDLPLERG